MGEENELGRLANEFGQDLEGTLTRWMHALDRRSWILNPLLEPDDSAGEDDEDISRLVRDRCGHILESLSVAFRRATRLEVGAPEFREAIQYLSFTAGWLAGAGLSITDAVALVHALQETMGSKEDAFFQSLLVVVVEAFSSSLDQKAQAVHRDAMEKSQLVCELHPRLPALFMVGDPDRHAVDDAVGRLMMLATMREASCVIVDVSGLIFAEDTSPGIIEILAEYGQAASVKVLLSGLVPSMHRRLSTARDDTFLINETLMESMIEATASIGVDWSTS